jgi:hypothetical protein
MIGGTGTDSLTGNGRSIIIAGSTSFDTNQSALASVLQGLEFGSEFQSYHHWFCPQQSETFLTGSDIQYGSSTDHITAHWGDMVYASSTDVVNWVWPMSWHDSYWGRWWF